MFKFPSKNGILQCQVSTVKLTDRLFDNFGFKGNFLVSVGREKISYPLVNYELEKN